MEDKIINANYWDTRYQSQNIGWDLGAVSPPLKEYIDQLKEKNCAILIPGCGNTYEAEYLLAKGFSNVTVIDIAPTLVKALQQKFENNPNIKIIEGDFFEHKGQYDLILEQTFFCAINPDLRQHYADKMYELLAQSGKLVGVVFDRTFDIDGPPFGGCKSEYLSYFNPNFEVQIFESCHNSFSARAGTELFLKMKKQ